MPDDCLLITGFYLVSDTNVVRINFKLNDIYALYELLVEQN